MSANQDLEVVTEGKHIRLVRRNGWEFVQRRQVSGTVGIIAVTVDRKLVLIEQYRAPVGKRVIEIPAGLAGDIAGQENESLAIAAARELEEETGFVADRMEQVGEGVASAGITDELITLFRATGVRRTGAGGGHAGEEIVVHEVPLDQVESWIAQKQQDGLLVDLKIYSALYFARR
jgi:ADP-ribose pyrophosphatase